MMKQVRLLLKDLFCDKLTYKVNIWIEDKDFFWKGYIYPFWLDRQRILLSVLPNKKLFLCEGTEYPRGLKKLSVIH